MLPTELHSALTLLNAGAAALSGSMLVVLPAYLFLVMLYLKLGAFKAVRLVQRFINKFFSSHCVHHSDHDGCCASCKQHPVGIIHVFLPEVSLAPPVGVIFAQFTSYDIAA